MDKQDKWSSFKTGFARTKHKLLVKVGNTEDTVNQQYGEECERMLSMFKVMKSINANCTKYVEALRAYSIEQTEMARAIVALYENLPPTCLAAQKYEEAAGIIEKQRITMEDSLRTYVIHPLTDYLSQQQDMKLRIKELSVRKLDMDRYFREYSKLMEKAGNDRSKVAGIESKYNITKEGYNNLCDEMMLDMPKLYHDRIVLFELLSAAYIKASANFYDLAETISNSPLPGVASIQEGDVHDRTKTTPSASAPPASITTAPFAGQPSMVPVVQTVPPVQTSFPVQVQPVASAYPVLPPPTTTVVTSTTTAFVPATIPSDPSHPQAQALFTFNAEEEGELSIKKGDIVMLHNTEGEWWEGEINGKRGLVPSNYLKRL